MLISSKIQQYQALDDWFQSTLGRFVAHEFFLHLDSVEKRFFGNTLLQFGGSSTDDWLKNLDYQHRWIVSPFNSSKCHILSDLDKIPLQKHSVDCVVAPLVLEPFKHDLGLIDEIDRVLKPMGHVILFCINPWSIWGSAAKLKLFNCYQDYNFKLYSALSINRIFQQRGYQQIHLGNFCYVPPVNNADWIKKLIFFEEIGKMIWPFPSGFYCFIAQKYQYVTPNKINLNLASELLDYPSLLSNV